MYFYLANVGLEPTPTSTRRIGLLGFVVLTQSSIYKESLDLMDTEAWK